MAAGFAFGAFFDPAPLRGLVLPLTFALVYPMMIGIDLRRLFAPGNPRLQFAALFLNFGVFPFIAAGLGRLVFPGSPYLQLGLVMAALLPTSGMTVTWTGLAKGNVPEAVRMTIIGLLAGSLATPFYLEALLGTSIELPLSAIIAQIVVVVLLPLIVGSVTRWALIRSMGGGKFEDTVKPLLPGVSTVCVIFLVFVAIALKSASILAEPEQLFATLWPVVVLYTLNFFLSTLVGRFFFTDADAKALVYGTVMRNLSIALAVIMSLLGPKGGEAALVVTWAYIVQVQSAAWYLKASKRFFLPAVV
jgi:ACR3 family arsenite efflux pump ArsB